MLLARPIFALINPEYVAATVLVWVLVPCLFLESLLTTAHNALIVYEHLKIIVISRLLTLVAVPLVILLTASGAISATSSWPGSTTLRSARCSCGGPSRSWSS